MENTELESIWRAYDQKMERMLAINKAVAVDLSRQKLSKQVGRLNGPKWFALAIGIPYAIIMIAVAVFASFAKAYLVAVGFGAIGLIMVAMLISYGYHLYLISEIKHSEDVLSTQKRLSELKVSSFKCLQLAVVQLPFWVVCWMSLDALYESPLLYGGVNLILFLLLVYVAYLVFQKVSYRNKDSKLRDFFLSGREWEPILRSAELLEQIKEYEEE